MSSAKTKVLAVRLELELYDFVTCEGGAVWVRDLLRGKLAAAVKAGKYNPAAVPPKEVVPKPTTKGASVKKSTKASAAAEKEAPKKEPTAPVLSKKAPAAGPKPANKDPRAAAKAAMAAKSKPAAKVAPPDGKAKADPSEQKKTAAKAAIAAAVRKIKSKK